MKKKLTPKPSNENKIFPPLAPVDAVINIRQRDVDVAYKLSVSVDNLVTYFPNKIDPTLAKTIHEHISEVLRFFEAAASPGLVAAIGKLKEVAEKEKNKRSE